ncbi:MAG: YncE family protein [Proteobacteria bacterium]|nr:YncE family protein [Pseudomonadota bacterium]
MKAYAFAAVLGSATMIAGAAYALDGWHLESATVLESKTATFDYVAYDAGTNRVFIGHRKEGLQVFDPVSKKLVKVIGNTPANSANGATLMPEFDLGVSNNEDGTITPFKLSTLDSQEPIKVSAELDTSHYDPFSKRLFVNGAAGDGGQDIVVIDVPSLKIAGTMKLPSKKVEHGDADGKGRMFLAEQDLGKVAVVDTKAMKLITEWSYPACAKPTSIAHDAANNRVFLGCRSKGTVKAAFLVLNGETGAALYTAEIGDGTDGAIYDPGMKRIFVAAGVNATLHVFEQVDANTYKPVETLGTRNWVKVLALDAKSKKLFSITAEGTADGAKKINTAVSPYYQNTVFPNTFTVLVYSR